MPRKLDLALAILLLLFAFGLRIYQLDAQSLWADEGATVVMAERSPADILLQTAEDIHPPLYYLVLHQWLPMVGTSEFSLRFPSVAAGIGFVALMLPLARRLRLRVGVLTMAIAAASPPLLYYSQEARMYMPVATAVAIATYLMLRLMSAPPRLNLPRIAIGLAYVAAAASALYLQYFAVAFLLFHNTAIVLSLLWRRQRGAILVEWASLQGIVVLLYFPWYQRAAEQLELWQTTGSFLAPPQLAEETLLFLAAGPMAEAMSMPATIVTAAIAVIGLLSLLIWRRWRGFTVIVLYMLAPLAVIYWLSLTRPLADFKVLLPALAPFCVLLAIGVDGFYRSAEAVAWWLTAGTAHRLPVVAGGTIAALGIAGLAFAFGPPLEAYFNDPSFARDDYRGLTRYIEAAGQPGDAIILNAPGQREIFDYYYRGDLERYPLPAERQASAVATSRQLEAIASTNRRAWVVLWGEREADPQAVVTGWLSRNAYLGWSRWFGRVHLALYTLPPATAVEQPLEVAFAGGIRLTAYALDTIARPGDSLRLSLVWQCTVPLARRYTVFTHLISDDAFLWGQHDAEPAAGARPATTWRPGEAIRDHHGIPVIAGTPPGEYWVEVGLYDQATGERLALATGDADRVVLGPVTVAKAQASPPPDDIAPAAADFGSVRLRGYVLTRRGGDAPATTFHRGEIANLSLVWEALASPAVDLQASLRLQQNGIVAAEASWASGGRYRTSAWEAGDIIRDQRQLPLDLPPGRYELLAGIGGELVVLTQLEVLR